MKTKPIDVILQGLLQNIRIRLGNARGAAAILSFNA
jgi:hypothetical protein